MVVASDVFTTLTDVIIKVKKTNNDSDDDFH